MEDIKGEVNIRRDESDIEKGEKEKKREIREEKKQYPHRNPSNYAKLKYQVMIVVSFFTLVTTISTFSLYFHSVSV